MLQKQIVPLDSIGVSSSENGFEPNLMFDANGQTYWKPVKGAKDNYVQVNFFTPHIIEYFDIMFVDNALYIISIEVLRPDGLSWLSLGTQMIRESNKINRIFIPTTFTKSIKIGFLSKEIDNHTYLEPLVSELRVYGEVDKNEPQGLITIPGLPCPSGYFKNEDGECVPMQKYDILLKKKGSRKKYGRLKKGEHIEIEVKDKKLIIRGFYIKIAEDEHPDVQFIVGDPDQYLLHFEIQKELTASKILLNEPLENVNKIRMILLTDTEIEIKEFYPIGEYV